MSTESKAARRMPRTCGHWDKLKPVNTERWLTELFETFVPEEPITRDEDAELEALGVVVADNRSRLTPTSVGVKWSPYESEILALGHLGNQLARAGVSPCRAPSIEVLEYLATWWKNDRQNKEMKAHHIVVSFAPRVADELGARGCPVPQLLLAAFAQTMAQFGARYYPGALLGMLATVQKVGPEIQVLALLHPTTSDGGEIDLSASEHAPAWRDRREYLKHNFNLRARQLLANVAHEQAAPEDREKLAARQFMLLARQAAQKAKTEHPDDREAVIDVLDDWLADRDFSTPVREAIRSAETAFYMDLDQVENRVPEANVERATWQKFVGELRAQLDLQLLAGRGLSKAVASSRDMAESYRPYRSRVAPPTVPMTSTYCRLAEAGSKRRITELAAAFAARREDSKQVSRKISAELAAYRASIAAAGRRMDQFQIRAAHGAAEVTVNASLCLGLPLDFVYVGQSPGRPLPRLVPSRARLEADSEQELENLAQSEAANHAPVIPVEQPSLLARPQAARLQRPAASTQDNPTDR